MADFGDDFLADFGVTATAGGQTFTVIIDRATHYRLETESIYPTIIGNTADVPSLAVGDAITVNSVSYQVAHPPLDDGAMTTIILKDA